MDLAMALVPPAPRYATDINHLSDSDKELYAVVVRIA